VPRRGLLPALLVVLLVAAAGAGAYYAWFRARKPQPDMDAAVAANLRGVGLMAVMVFIGCRVPGAGYRPRSKKTEERPLVSVGIPGPIDARERLLGPFFVLPPAEAGQRLFACRVPTRGRHSTCFTAYSTSSVPSGTPGWSALMPSTPFTFSSISAIIAGLSFRYIFAFSRPWPIFWPL